MSSTPLIAGGLEGLQLEHAQLCLTQAIAPGNGGAQVVIGDSNAVELLQALEEQAALLVPAVALVSTVTSLGKVQNVRLLELGEELIHFFLAVTSGLAYDHVAEIREGALFGVGEAVGRLDQRAQVRGKNLLGLGNDLIGGAAQGNAGGAGGVDNLKRGIATQIPD